MTSSRSPQKNSESKGNVYSYMRFSDPRQAGGHSGDRQRAYAAKWAADHGLHLDESLSMEDKGLSAYHQHHVKHGALGLFLEAVSKGRVPEGSVLVVEGLDRLSRAEPLLAQGQLAQIINAGISVVTASDNRIYSRESLKRNPMELIHSLIVMIRAHEESETKSQRIKAAIRRQCEAWIAGTYRGLIRNGTDPSWVRWNGQKFEFDETRAEVVRQIVDMYRAGYGAMMIARALAKTGETFTGRPIDVLQLHRMIRQKGLKGVRVFEVGDARYELEGYYPALMTAIEFDELQAIVESRSQGRTKSGITNIVTGLNIARCGYCGGTISTQNNMSKRAADGSLRDTYRRLICAGAARHGTCPHPASRSIVPVESAIISYCSDMLNLRALYRGDRSAEARARLVLAKSEMDEIQRKLDRITNALLESDEPPTSFMQKARELEAERDRLRKGVTDAENDVAATTRNSIEGVDAKWRELAAGVRAMDEDARIRARQLVSDTFESITIYAHGIRPSEALGVYDVVLVAKGGSARMIRVSASGEWMSGDQIDQEPSQPHSADVSTAGATQVR